MGDVIIKPLGRIKTRDGPLYVTVVDNVVVHGDKPMTVEGREAMSALIGAAKRMVGRRRLMEDWRGVNFSDHE